METIRRQIIALLSEDALNSIDLSQPLYFGSPPMAHHAESHAKKIYDGVYYG